MKKIKEQLKYNENKRHDILEIYKMYVESTQHISDCRQKSNNFYILLNTGIIAYTSFFNYLLVLLFGVLINIIWFCKINSYKRLNSAKFKVVNFVEKQLPIEVFNMEYKILKEGKHKNLSFYESCIPLVFITVFVLKMFIYNFDLLKQIGILILNYYGI